MCTSTAYMSLWCAHHRYTQLAPTVQTHFYNNFTIGFSRQELTESRKYCTPAVVSVEKHKIVQESLVLTILSFALIFIALIVRYIFSNISIALRSLSTERSYFLFCTPNLSVFFFKYYTSFYTRLSIRRDSL